MTERVMTVALAFFIGAVLLIGLSACAAKDAIEACFNRTMGCS